MVHCVGKLCNFISFFNVTKCTQAPWLKREKTAFVQFSCDNAVDLRICEIWHLKETAQKTYIDYELIFWPVSEFQRRCPAVQDPPCLLSSGSIAIGQFRIIRRRSGSIKAQCSRLHQERWKAGFFGQRSHQVWPHHIFSGMLSLTRIVVRGPGPDC